MNQLINQGVSTGSSGEAPVKRKRGRPRKDESQSQPVDKQSPASRPLLRPFTTSIQGDASVTANTPMIIPSKGKDNMQLDVDTSADDEYNNDEMVGQVVTGVLQSAFDAGYFITVRVGNSNLYMRGVVFKEGCVVPVTPENDIAPNAKMYKRRDLPIPVSLTPQAPQNVVNSITKPTEMNDIRQQRMLNPADGVSDKEIQNVTLETVTNQQDTEISHDKEQNQEKLTVINPTNIVSERLEWQNSEGTGVQDRKDTEPHDEGEEQKELGLSKPAQNFDQVFSSEDNATDQRQDEKASTEVAEHSPELKDKGDLSEKANLDGLLEHSIKLQKTDETTEAHANGKPFTEFATGDEIHVKADERVTTDTATLPLEEVLPPQIESIVNDPISVATAQELESCGNPGFQINVEKMDNVDTILSEPPTEMQTTQQNPAMSTKRVIFWWHYDHRFRL